MSQGRICYKGIFVDRRRDRPRAEFKVTCQRAVFQKQWIILLPQTWIRAKRNSRTYQITYLYAALAILDNYARQIFTFRSATEQERFKTSFEKIFHGI